MKTFSNKVFLPKFLGAFASSMPCEMTFSSTQQAAAKSLYISRAVRYFSKSLENSKSAFVCCSDELRGWVCNNSPKSKNCVSTSYSSSDLTMGSNVYSYFIRKLICIAV